MKRPKIRPYLAGVLVSLLAAGLLFLSQETGFETPRELYFDALTQWVPAPHSPDIVVIDIDRASSLATATGAWTRTDMAALLTTVADAKPAAVAVDFLFSTDCTAENPANAALANAMAAAPTVLGFLIAETMTALPHPVPPIAVRKPLAVSDLWFIDGAETSCTVFEDKARSAAAAFLVGDEDARVRRVQAYAILDNTPYPALGLEAARLARGNATPILGGDPAWLRLGSGLIDLDRDGSLRFAASTLAAMAARTVTAGDVVAGRVPPQRFAGKLVFVGSSLPNLGGLRESAAMPLAPSVQIHADIANGILTGFLPKRDNRFPLFEAGFAALAGCLMSLVTRRLRPVPSALFGLAVIAATIAASVALYASGGWLLDGAGVGLALASVLAVTSTLQFARSKRAETAARRKFAQYLPQSVVTRFLDNPDAARTAGEERQVTALFTDIEGFSALTQKLGARELIVLLDIYFAEVTALVEAHGGMVDKIVGDAVHALFNAPEDLEGHVAKAVTCGQAIRALSEEMRQRPEFARHGFGRTRIGIETGMAVLGEVGAGGRLDYTAHGDAVNLAARLQDANKFLGTAICIGPEAAVQSGRSLRPLGVHEIRGFGAMHLFTIDDG